MDVIVAGGNRPSGPSRGRILLGIVATLWLAGAPAAAETQVEALRARAAAGDGDAQFRYGTLRYYGLGVVQDWNDAVLWLTRAAGQGQAGAQCELGMIYQIGSDGVLQDFAKAASLYRAAAQQGDDDARLALAGLYTAGQGVPKDAAAATSLLQRAAVPRAALDAPGGALARLYRHFLGVATAVVPLPDDQQVP